jgi:hypothetical protein
MLGGGVRVSRGIHVLLPCLAGTGPGTRVPTPSSSVRMARGARGGAELRRGIARRSRDGRVEPRHGLHGLLHEERRLCRLLPFNRRKKKWGWERHAVAVLSGDHIDDADILLQHPALLAAPGQHGVQYVK